MNENADPVEVIKALNKQPMRTWNSGGWFTYHCELDKIRGWWVMTYWSSDGAALRLKVRVPTLEVDFDCHYVCEVRLKRDEDFQEVAKGLTLDLLSIDLCLDEAETVNAWAVQVYTSFPAGWRSEFWQYGKTICGHSSLRPFGANLYRAVRRRTEYVT